MNNNIFNSNNSINDLNRGRVRGIRQVRWPPAAELILLEIMLEIHNEISIESGPPALRRQMWSCTADLIKEAMERNAVDERIRNFLEAIDGDKVYKKWINLVYAYKKDLEQARVTGNSTRRGSKYFDKIAAITANDPNIHPAVTSESNDEGTAEVDRLSEASSRLVADEIRDKYFTPSEINLKVIDEGRSRFYGCGPRMPSTSSTTATTSTTTNNQATRASRRTSNVPIAIRTTAAETSIPATSATGSTSNVPIAIRTTAAETSTPATSATGSTSNVPIAIRTTTAETSTPATSATSSTSNIPVAVRTTAAETNIPATSTPNVPIAIRTTTTTTDVNAPATSTSNSTSNSPTDIHTTTVDPTTQPESFIDETSSPAPTLTAPHVDNSILSFTSIINDFQMNVNRACQTMIADLEAHCAARHRDSVALEELRAQNHLKLLTAMSEMRKQEQEHMMSLQRQLMRERFQRLEDL